VTAPRPSIESTTPNHRGASSSIEVGPMAYGF
jgi:hypothetical protein